MALQWKKSERIAYHWSARIEAIDAFYVINNLGDTYTVHYEASHNQKRDICMSMAEAQNWAEDDLHWRWQELSTLVQGN
jgi:hypothetical protein